eukprot:gb/GEZN01023589.1/.p1 GENE.gb/GEZN01023589.1/~~gb/GEZN01023589.1/.p1  ORF type:complete len:168 (-),score=38.50 gb/GEZN01023589.1/:65-568(-)
MAEKTKKTASDGKVAKGGADGKVAKGGAKGIDQFTKESLAKKKSKSPQVVAETYAGISKVGWKATVTDVPAEADKKTYDFYKVVVFEAQTPTVEEWYVVKRRGDVYNAYRSLNNFNKHSKQPRPIFLVEATKVAVLEATEAVEATEELEALDATEELVATEEEATEE